MANENKENQDAAVVDGTIEKKPVIQIPRVGDFSDNSAWLNAVQQAKASVDNNKKTKRIKT